MFLGSASAVSLGSMMIEFRNNFGKHASDGALQCNADSDGNCKLTGSYGTGIFAMSIISIVFNAALFLTMAVKWFQGWKKRGNMRVFHVVFTLTTLAVMMAVAAAGYDLFVQQNFGKEFINGDINCDEGSVSTCSSLNGKDMQVVTGLNATSIALSGMVLLSSVLIMFDRGVGGPGMIKGSTSGSLADEIARPFERGMDVVERPFRTL